MADETAKLTLVGFKENTIRVLEAPGEADKNADGFLAIYADGWKDFYIDENGYLAATPVPEPAGFAVILGVVSLYCMVRRRRSWVWRIEVVPSKLRAIWAYGRRV